MTACLLNSFLDSPISIFYVVSQAFLHFSRKILIVEEVVIIANCSSYYVSMKNVSFFTICISFDFFYKTRKKKTLYMFL